MDVYTYCSLTGSYIQNPVHKSLIQFLNLDLYYFGVWVGMSYLMVNRGVAYHKNARFIFWGVLMYSLCSTGEMSMKLTLTSPSYKRSIEKYCSSKSIEGICRLIS